MTVSTRRIATVLLVALCVAVAGCTIVREGNGDNDQNSNNEGENVETVYNDIPADADIVDAVAFVEVSHASSGISSGYSSYINEVELALAAQGVFIRDLAVAPLYRQQGGRPPLLYGRGASNNLHSSLKGTLEYYLTDDGRDHLDDMVEVPAENPAALGLELDREPVYNPETGSGDGSPYFREPEDGFVVFHITGTARNCTHGEADCTVDNTTPADYFTRTDDDGDAEWLNLPGSGLSPDDVVHVSVATAEDVDYETFSDSCTGRPDFPGAYLDFLAPSTDHVYYENFTSELGENGGAGHNADLCNALSSELDGSASQTASTITDAIR